MKEANVFLVKAEIIKVIDEISMNCINTIRKPIKKILIDINIPVLIKAIIRKVKK